MITLYHDETDSSFPRDSSSTKISDFAEECSLFVHLFRVRPESMAPFLWKNNKDLEMRYQRKMRKVQKKKGCSEGLFHKQKHWSEEFTDQDDSDI